MPYSTLIALTSEIRETPVDDLDEIPDEKNLVICDTKVLLRINQDETENSSKAKKISNKRMTRRLLNYQEQAYGSTGVPVVQAAKKLPKRKDLCKLLGLNEQDVDLCIVPEVKVAQKVALTHCAPTVQTSKKDTAKKKDLAKFLGVEEGQTPQAIRDTSLEKMSRKSDPSPNGRNFLSNWGQMVKSSVGKWSSNTGDCEMDVPVQLRQMPAKEPTERTHRKDLSKFLGFDDSDSEEIVFIRNANPSINDSSLTRKSSETDAENGEDSDEDSVGSLRSFDSFVRRSLRCGASSEFATQIEEGAKENSPKRGEQNLVTLDRKTSRNKHGHKVVFGPNSRRLISPVRSKKRQQMSEMPPIFLREEPLLVYPQKPALFYQHYPLYTSYGILPPGGRINPNNGRVRFPRHQAKRPPMNS